MLTRRAFAATAASAAVLPGQTQRPNVVLLMPDDLGYNDLGCTGSDYLRTPHLDSLARTGVRFSNWYSNAAMCAPARAGLMTGRYPHRCGVPGNGPPLMPKERALPALFKEAGYRTALVGKWHLGSTPETVPNAHGFDEFFGFHWGCVDYYSHRNYWGEPNRVNFHDLWRNREEVFEDGHYFTDLMEREAVAYLRRQQAGRPFFLSVMFAAPHYPMHAPEADVRPYAHLDLERRVRAGMIASMDDAVGAILHELDRRRMRENTIVLFMSDNGATREPRAGLGQKPPAVGLNTPFRGFKFSHFDGGIHVPALVSWPAALPAGKVNAGLASHIDVLPTLCAAAGIAPPSDRTIDGRNLLPMMRDGSESPREALFWADGRGQGAVRKGDWKLVLNGSDFDYATGKAYVPLAGEDTRFLSNLENDPGERRNVAGQHPERARELEQMWKDWRADVEKH